ncbi:MAG: YHYH protein [Planctomycetaceae bacterium]
MTKSIARTLLLTFVILSVQPFTIAHDGVDDHFHTSPVANVRTWTITESGATIEGTFVTVKDRRVHIRQTDGLIRPVTIDRLAESDQQWIDERTREIAAINTQSSYMLTAQRGNSSKSKGNFPAIAESFRPFEKFAKVRWDEDFLFVESNGMPDHKMMVGITAWQQQVPLPQNYTGENAWQIPLHPVPAKNPMSARNNFFRGAIALAVNGIPIFNPIKNDGRTDTLLAGELDAFGGHCGRADDYHYHIPPIHLEKVVGKGKPLAWALDGYPIMGLQEKRNPDFAPLDQWNGHKDKDGNYHYHSTKTYPYLNGGFYGEVVERDGQVDPQPRAEPVRPALPPMRDAKITDFVETKPGSYKLTYDVRGRKGTVSYSIVAGGSVAFEFVSPDGSTTNEEYSPNRRGGGRRPGPPNDSRPPRGEGGPPRDGKGGKKRGDESTSSQKSQKKNSKDDTTFTVASSSLDKSGMLSIECTCDGDRESPAVAWKNLPMGTRSIAISLWHTAPDQEKSYWVVYNIPAVVSELKQQSRGVGTLGINDRKRAEYDPMCSKGPGVKTYHITVFALSEDVKLSANKASRAELLKAVKDITLGETTLDFEYERK